MGIFGAMTTAVSGLRAQSFALEHISGNIANSQTIGYKRTETSFADLVPESPPWLQTAGSVNAYSRATNALRGDTNASDVDTHFAVIGDGYFIVERSAGTVDGVPLFSGNDVYTRRGDFARDRNGFLVNGAGYYLKGLPLDPSTGNPTGSLPEIIELSDALLPARSSSEIGLTGNLPIYPRTRLYNAAVPGSELLSVSSFNNDPTVAGDGFVRADDVDDFINQTIAGGAITAYDQNGSPANVQFRWAKIQSVEYTAGSATGTDIGADSQTMTALGLTDGQTLSFSDGTDSVTFEIDTNSTSTPGNVAVTGTTTLAQLLTSITTNLGTSNVDATVTNSGSASNFSFNIASNLDPATINVAASDAQVLTTLGLDGIGSGTSISRDIKPSSEDKHVWNLFYQEDALAQNDEPLWRNVGVDYHFVDGHPQPPINSVEITGMTVNNVDLGNIIIDHGGEGITQFSDSSGIATGNVTQNGYAAGKIERVSLNDDGRLVASYTNEQTLDIAELTLATFNADNMLQKLDGGAFAATADSGEASFGSRARILGQRLENSNADIADEFTKLIITQQAYAANTRVISTSDEMLQEALNMMR